MDKDELKKVYSVINDIWDFEKSFYYPQKNDEFWEKLHLKVKELSAKHNSLFMDNLLVSCVDDIECRASGGNATEHFNHIVEVIRKGRQYDHNS